MYVPDDESKLRSVSFDIQGNKPTIRRKYIKNMESELMPRRTELKIVRIDEHILSSPTTANIVNLQFNEDAPTIFKRSNMRRPSKKMSGLGDERRAAALQKQLGKSRYHQLFKESMDYFFKNTIQIGPCAKIIQKEHQLSDGYCRRKLINIEKLAFPLRDNKKEMTGRYKYKTLMNKTSRVEGREQRDVSDLIVRASQKQRNKSVIDPPQGDHYQYQCTLQQQSDSVLGSSLLSKPQINIEYKKQIVTLIPIRKPNNKKDYFVFGLGDRTNTAQNKIQIYRDLLWKVNYSNGLYVHTPENIPLPYKFYVGEGNNSNLIRGILKRRFWWGQASSKTEDGINFIWTQLKINSLFSGQQSGSPPQYFVMQRIRSEANSLMSTACAIDSQNDPNKRLFGRIDYKIWKSHQAKNEKTEKKIGEGTYQKRVKMYQKKKITKLNDSRQIKTHNHLQCNYYIGNKKALFYNMKRYLQLKGQPPFSILPLTFHIAKGVDDPQYIKFVKCYQQIQEERKVKKHIRNIWIVKPGENTNRGNGITVCYSIDDVKLRLKGRQRNGDGKLRTFILQKYIENPLLYNKRKFDIRHYALISCINGCFKGYWYDQGYVRTSSAEFNIKSCKDPLIHLTNDAIQKNTPEYGKFQKANKLSYQQLQKYLQTAYPNKKYNFYQQIMPKMKHFATEAIKATYSILDPNRKKHNFQLLGLDFMIDQDFEPWLIEVNTNPCLQLCCPHLSRIIPAVVENVFKLCVDPLFPPPQNWPSNRKPYLGDDPLSDNKFQLVFDQTSDGRQVQKLFLGKQLIDGKMGKIEQQDQTFDNQGQVQWQKQ